jgi:hypothetical protein
MQSQTKPDLSGYATNINLNNLSTFSALNISNLTIISNNKQDIYTAERQYPPKLYDSSIEETTTTFLNKTVFTQTTTLNTAGITYGSGDYIIYSSSVFPTGDQTLYRKKNSFNFITTDVGGHWNLNYNTQEFYYSGANFIKNDYFGDWIMIQLHLSLYAASTNLNNLSTNSTLAIINKTNFTNFYVSGASTLLSSLNVSGPTNLNTVNIQGNLNVYGTTTVIDTAINNTTFNSLRVSGPSVYYSNVTLRSSLNVSGNIIGSGTALTNLNYNAILVSFNNPSTFVSTLTVSGNTT